MFTATWTINQREERVTEVEACLSVVSEGGVARGKIKGRRTWKNKRLVRVFSAKGGKGGNQRETKKKGKGQDNTLSGPRG